MVYRMISRLVLALAAALLTQEHLCYGAKLGCTTIKHARHV